MYDKFRSLGIPVIMTRNTDETLSPDTRVQRVLNAFGSDPNVIVISNHINAGGGDGAEIIYPLRNSDALPNLILKEIEKEGQNVRKAYQRRYPSNTSKDYYFMQRNTSPTQAITVEYGFLDSTKDDVNQLKQNYKRYTDAVVRAVLDYIGLGNNEGYYIVQKGDSLYSIAQKNGITVDMLKEENNLTSNLLNIGQKLKIPKIQNSNSNNKYIVQKGDSLYSIAQKNGITVDMLKEENNLTSNLLNIGQQLKIPNIQNSNSNNIYIVKSGDNLYSISKKYNITQKDLMDYNNLTSNLLTIGQQLKIPKNNSNNNIYIVEKGDSLYSIAKKYGKTVDYLKEINNLSTSLLSIGQKLIVK